MGRGSGTSLNQGPTQPRPQCLRDIQNGGTEKTLVHAGKYSNNRGVFCDETHLIFVFGTLFAGSNMAIYHV